MYRGTKTVFDRSHRINQYVNMFHGKRTGYVIVICHLKKHCHVNMCYHPKQKDTVHCAVWYSSILAQEKFIEASRTRSKQGAFFKEMGWAPTVMCVSWLPLIATKFFFFTVQNAQTDFDILQHLSMKNALVVGWYLACFFVPVTL